MNIEPASGAVEDEPPEFALEVRLHLQQLEPKHLGMNRDRLGCVEAGIHSLVNRGISGFQGEQTEDRKLSATSPATRWAVLWHALYVGEWTSGL